MNFILLGQCEQCGPPGMGGRCYGPQICCSPQFGCMVGGPTGSACQQETHSPTLCHNNAISCDGSGETGPVNGQCAALGICCTAGEQFERNMDQFVYLTANLIFESLNFSF